MYMWRERSKEEKHEDVVNTGLLPLDVVEGFKIRPGFFKMCIRDRVEDEWLTANGIEEGSSWKENITDEA